MEIGTDNRATSSPPPMRQAPRRRRRRARRWRADCKLLQAVADGGEGVAVRELARAAALPRSIVQRLLYTLEAEGFLERHPSQIGYRLSIKLWGLGCAAVRRLTVRDVARPYLEDLSARTSEMTKLGVLDGTDVVYIDRVECPLAVRAYVPIGGRAPAHSVATGKAILAFLPADKLRGGGGVLGKSHSKPLQAEFEQIRRRGFPSIAANGSRRSGLLPRRYSMRRATSSPRSASSCRRIA